MARERDRETEKEREGEREREKDPSNDGRFAASQSCSPETAARFAEPLSRDQR